MKKKVIKVLALLVGFLFIFSNLAFAAETKDDDVTTLKEVEVTATPLEKYLVTTSVITDKDIEKKGAQNLAEALEGVPGLNVHRGGGKDTTVVEVRGMNTDYTKIFVDGVPFNPVADRKVDIRMIPTNNIAKIEVIKGPTPVVYGTDAIGGVILITTKNGKDYKGGKISLYGGEYNTINGNVSYGDGNDKFDYFVSGGAEKTNGFQEHANREAKYINTKLNWQLDNNSSLTVLGGYSTTDKDGLNKIDPVDGHILESACKTCSFWSGLNNWEFRDWERSYLSMSYQNQVSDKFNYNLKAYRFTDRNGLWAYANQSGKGYEKGWNASYWDSTLTGLELQGNLRLNSQHLLTLGTVYNKNDYKKSNSATSRPYEYGWDEYNVDTTGYYLQDTYTPSNKTTVTLGLRHEKNEATNKDNKSNTKSVDNPSLNVVYQLDEKNTLRAAYGETCRFPTLGELYSKNPNPDLKPEEAKNYEIGLRHTFDNSLTGNFSVFKNDVEHMIIKDNTTNSGFDYVNLNYAKIKGLELELNKNFNPRLSGFLNYTYLDTKTQIQTGTKSNYKYEERDLQYTPHNIFNYGLTYKGDKGYSLDVTGHYVAKRATWDDDGHTITDGRTGNQYYPSISGYHVVDLKVSRKINDKQDWFIICNNLFDKKYEDELFYVAPGRNVMIGSNFKF